jgi:hypothetical protein
VNDIATSLKLDDDNPWPGLAAYDEASTRYFHGREKDSAELLRLIKLSPFVAFYGKSGLGKSSLLQAGVFPQLRRARFLPVYLRLDYTDTAQQSLLNQAMLRLRQEIDSTNVAAAQPVPGEGLWAYLQRRELPIWSADNYPLTPVLVFDQFEELFSRGGSPEHVDKVLHSMADLVADRVPADLADDPQAAEQLNLQARQYHLVLSFRSDFLADVESWERQARLPRRESLHLMAMSPKRAVAAIKSAGAAVVEPGVEEQIVKFLLQREGRDAPGRDAEVEPVLLSLCCYQLNRRRRRPAKIDAGLVEKVGKGILKGFYEEALAGMEPRVSKFIEDNLIQGSYRSSYARAEALASGALTKDELEQLMHNRLLRVDPQGEVPRIELIHDRLVSVVREERDERRAREKQERDRVAAQDKAREEVERLKREAEMAEQRARGDRERERAEQTERERARVARSRNGLVAVVVLMVAAFGGLAYYYLDAQHKTAEVTKAADDLKQALADQSKQLQNERDNAEIQIRLLKLKAVRDEGDKQAAQVTVAAVQRQLDEEKRQREEEAARKSTATSLIVADWGLSSGGCNKGAVSVAGDAVFTVRPKGGDVIVKEVFEGKGSGFGVKVNAEATLPKSDRNYYDIETEGTWNGPGARTFKTKGVDRVYVDAALTPRRANILKIRTDC